MKNVQDGTSRPQGSREIQKTKVANVLRDTLYEKVVNKFLAMHEQIMNNSVKMKNKP